MKKSHVVLLAAAAASLGLTLGTAGAEERIGPQPIITAYPTFDCSVTVNEATGSARIAKANAVAIDKTKDVIAVVNTPGGKVAASTCGSAFASNAVGTAVHASFSNPQWAKDKSFVYTCTAAQVASTRACNPAK
jgi:hypothetical protein